MRLKPQEHPTYKVIFDRHHKHERLMISWGWPIPKLEIKLLKNYFDST